MTDYKKMALVLRDLYSQALTNQVEEYKWAEDVDPNTELGQMIQRHNAEVAEIQKALRQISNWTEQ